MKSGRRKRPNPSGRKPVPKVRSHFRFRDHVSNIGYAYERTGNLKAAFKELTLSAGTLGPKYKASEKRFNRDWRVVLLEDAVTELKVQGMPEEELSRFKAASAKFLKIENKAPSYF